VIQNTSYMSQSFSLTTSWALYTWNFTAAETSPQVKFQYSNTGTYYIDNAQLISQTTNGNTNITVNPATTYQTMVGFGGGVTWYCDLITKNAKKAELVNLMFNDMGTDIVRFKNWYYPAGYPNVKTTSTMAIDYFKGHFDATNELYTLAKGVNPSLQVLLSSWSPPSAYKSNNALEAGTLAKSNGQFMYSQLGQYYKDALDNIAFNPDYFSFQNEPGYANTGWSTCEWRPTETTDYPGYDKGFDAVYSAISTRSYVPKMLGPEVENLGSAVWNSSLNTYREMATAVKNKSNLYGYAYHLYNFGSNPNNINTSTLNMVRDEFSNKPNFMTEFSSGSFDWLATADVIHQTVVEANASAYIYWDLMWDAAATTAAVGIDGSTGNYTINNQFYTLKHFAKYVDSGYKRISVKGSNSNLEVSGFLNPAGNQITLVAINKNTSSSGMLLNFGTNTVSSATAYQSVVGNFFKSLGTVNTANAVSLPAQSITTFVVNLSNVVTNVDNNSIQENITVSPNPFSDYFSVSLDSPSKYIIYDLNGKIMDSGVADQSSKLGLDLPMGVYILKGDNISTQKIIKVNK